MTQLTENDWGRIFAKAWSDPAFREAYEADPRGAIQKHAEELDLDPNAKFSFPEMPKEMSEDQAKEIAEGSAKPQPMYCC